MRDFCAQLGGKKAHNADAEKRINMYKTNGIRDIGLILYSKEHKTERTSNGNR